MTHPIVSESSWQPHRCGSWKEHVHKEPVGQRKLGALQYHLGKRVEFMTTVSTLVTSPASDLMPCRLLATLRVNVVIG